MDETRFSSAASFGAVPCLLRTSRAKAKSLSRPASLWFVVLGMASFPAWGLGGHSSCQGPNCPGLVETLGFLVAAFVLLNVLGALWMIGRKINSIWRRWRYPQASVAAEQPTPDDSPSH